MAFPKFDPDYKSKLTDNVFIAPPALQLHDELTLAKGTPFETNVTRYTHDIHHGWVSALIEEIQQLKERVRKLEEKNG